MLIHIYYRKNEIERAKAMKKEMGTYDEISLIERLD
jgi:hypothetical protein